MKQKRLTVFLLLLLSSYPVWSLFSTNLSLDNFLLNYADNLSTYCSNSLYLEYQYPVSEKIGIYAELGFSRAVETASVNKYTSLGNLLLCDVEGGVVYGTENFDLLVSGGIKPVFFNKSLRLMQTFASVTAGIDYCAISPNFYSGLRIFCFFNANGIGAGLSICGKVSIGGRK